MDRRILTFVTISITLESSPEELKTCQEESYRSWKSLNKFTKVVRSLKESKPVRYLKKPEPSLKELLACIHAALNR